MKRKAGRCTAAYESKAYPFFTFNVKGVINRAPHGTFGEMMAYLQRQRFNKKYQGLLELLRVSVDEHQQLHSTDKNAIDLLMAIIREVHGSQRCSWVTHETF